MEENDPSHNSITEQKQLSKKSKRDSKYTKISTDEESNFEPLEIKVEKEEIMSSTSGFDDFHQANPIVIEPAQNYCFKKLGNTFSFFADRDGNPLIIIGPHWPMYVCFNSLVAVGMFFFFYAFWMYLNIFFQAFGILIYSTFSLSYTYTVLINPGYPKHDLESRTGKPRAKFRFCKGCKMWVNIEKGTNHCFDCNICVEGYDHHCPWTGKCIGKRNITSFYIFVISTLFLFAYVVCALTNAQSNKTRRGL